MPHYSRTFNLWHGDDMISLQANRNQLMNALGNDLDVVRTVEQTIGIAQTALNGYSGTVNVGGTVLTFQNGILVNVTQP